MGALALSMVGIVSLAPVLANILRPIVGPEMCIRDSANTKLAGEVIGIMAGPNPAEVKSGLNAAVDFIENGACFYLSLIHIYDRS